MFNSYKWAVLAITTYLSKQWDPQLANYWLEEFYTAEVGVPFVIKTKDENYDVIVHAIISFRIEYFELKNGGIELIMEPFISTNTTAAKSREIYNKIFDPNYTVEGIDEFCKVNLESWAVKFSHKFFQIKRKLCPVYDGWTEKWTTTSPIPWKWDNENKNYPLVQTIDFIDIIVKTRSRTYELNVHPAVIIGCGVMFAVFLAWLK